MLQQVSEKLLGKFVDSLEAKLAVNQNPAPQPEALPTHNGAAPLAAPAPAPPETEPIDLLQLAGGGALKKYGPPVLGAFLAAAVVFTLGRLRIARKALRRSR